jgi:hypothetical protein
MLVMKSPSYHLPMTFEDFLKDADNRPESDPGTAMVEVLKRNRVNGINLDRILASSDPRNNPGKVLAFLRRIAQDGSWEVNLSIRIN